MSEQTPEQKVPTKEEVLLFLSEQIEVKSKQVELQELNTKLAAYRAEELKALQVIAQISNPQPPADAVPHVLTQEDLDQNPEISKQGYKVGDEVLVSKETSERKLKK